MSALLLSPPDAVPRRVSGSDSAWPLHDIAATRRLERTDLPDHTLMRRAGRALARWTLAIAPHARRVLVLAGPGNNGGDGLEAAMHLMQAGCSVQAVLLSDPARLPPDARQSLVRAQAAGVAIDGTLPTTFDADVAIDALLGVGASRAPDGALADAIDRLAASALPVLAVDLPSGLHAETGALLGRAAVRARNTLALLTLKPGLFTAQGRDHAGGVWLDTLSVSADHEAPCARLAGRPEAPERLHAQHKGSFGDVLVVGGDAGMSGAALLAGRAALAAGAGRVYVGLLDDAVRHDPLRPELMVRPGASADRRLAGTATVVCGCGGGDTTLRSLLPLLLHAAPRLVLDADALNAVAADASLQAALAARAPRGSMTLLTPHPLEAARLLGISAAQVQAGRLGAAAALSARLQATVLLKGSGSIAAAPGALPRINPTGNALLATAGTGDVLAGWLGGRWSQQPARAAQDIAADGAHEHGAAADRARDAGRRAALTASALIDLLAAPG